MLINQAMIYTEHLTIPKAKAVVVITHGIALHAMYYRNLAELLNKGGYSVILYDVRGHGKSQGKRGDIKHVDDFVNDLFRIVVDIKKHTDLPIYLLGHSMGGIITNLYTTEHTNYDGSIILSAPYKRPSFGIFNFIPFRLLGFFRIPTDFNDDRLSHFPPSNDLDPYALKSFTFRLVGNLMKVGLKRINKNIDKIEKPIVILHGTDDQLTPSLQSELLYENLKVKDKTLKLIEGGYHNLHHDTVTDEVAQTIIMWLDDRT